jgi:hypothetical protein
MHCVALSKRTGERCNNWSVFGGTVCRMHGGKAPQVRARGEIRMTLGELLAQDPRPVGTVLLDAVRDADALLSDARTRVSVDGETTAQDMTRFIEALERAAKLSKVALDAGVMRAIVQQRDQELALMELAGGRAVDALMVGLDVVLGAIAEDKREALRRRALDAMRAALVGASPHDVPPAIEPGPPAVLRAEVERESTVDTRDDGEHSRGA